jgi:hypothetical protein
MIAEEMYYGDRTILVTVPFPDTIELTADILNEHMPAPAATGGGAKAIYAKIDQELMEWAAGTKKGETLASPKPYVKLGDKAVVQFDIAYDPAQPLHRARLTLARQTGTEYPVWTVKYEFSSSKAGPAGLVKLTSAFEQALPFQFAAMLPAFRVSRVDPAIDLIGAYPIDLIAHIPKPGKRLVYVGVSGRPESVYLYDRKKPLEEAPSSLSYNTLGTLRLKMYERRDYMKQLKLPPPYGECPVTRIEIERRWRKKKQRPLLANLNLIANPLTDRRVSYAAALAEQTSAPKEWLAFCLAAFGGGVTAAQWKWHATAQGLKYRNLYRDVSGDLIHPGRWEGWTTGLDVTGLSSWIAAAGQ